ncbi:uncharacterized protein LY89DRAFT_777055 [Mollisia scopiformis]|uniref:Tautomerase cis-CaaD-like domain-containing protein n=1 Tax=Mollisia scopiformis TaxID=149040 RepID=A0A194XU88_MOLSC|nr:uncharacterized protein LY89DRAFT_777055 [Mollisia scopiformis]KUJ23272.1 hypothetical protein LY89DRAFT_777055 [Mollisia scopiformis]
MPFYEIIHHTNLTHTQRETLASEITTLHSKTFSAPTHFVNIKFSPSHNASILAPSSPTVPDYFVAGRARTHPNLIFAHVRGGASRSNVAFAKLAEDIEKIWDDVVGLPMYHPSGRPAETHPTQASQGGGDEKEKEKEGGEKEKEKGINWNDERRLQAVFIVPGLIARESGLAIPEAGGEREWLQQNMATFKKRAEEGDEDMKSLVDEVEGRRKPTTAEQQNAEQNGGEQKEVPDRTKN